MKRTAKRSAAKSRQPDLDALLLDKRILDVIRPLNTGQRLDAAEEFEAFARQIRATIDGRTLNPDYLRLRAMRPEFAN